MAEEQDAISQDLISRIVSGDTTLDDLEVLKGRFGSDKDTLLRKEFVAILSEKLSDDALHKFNSKVMEYSTDLAVSPDTKFMYRTPNMKFFQEMLVSEAKREGMRVELDQNGIVENTILSDIPPKMLEHYAVLNKNLHTKHGNENNNDVIAEVISWVLTASLARESEYYKQADETTQQALELGIINPEKDKTRKSLNDRNILDQVKAVAIEEQTPLKPEPEKASEILSLYLSTQESLEIIREVLDSLDSKDNPYLSRSPEGKQIEQALLESLKDVPYETLQDNKKEVIKFLKKALKEQVRDNKLVVSKQDLSQLKKDLRSKAQAQSEVSRWSAENAKLLADRLVGSVGGLSVSISDSLKHVLQPVFKRAFISLTEWEVVDNVIDFSKDNLVAEVRGDVKSALDKVESLPSAAVESISEGSRSFFSKVMSRLRGLEKQEAVQGESIENIAEKKIEFNEELASLWGKVIKEEMEKLNIKPKAAVVGQEVLQQKNSVPVALEITNNAIDELKKRGVSLGVKAEQAIRETLSQSLQNVDVKILEKNHGSIQRDIANRLSEQKVPDTILPKFMSVFITPKEFKVPGEALRDLGKTMVVKYNALGSAGKEAHGMLSAAKQKAVNNEELKKRSETLRRVRPSGRERTSVNNF